MNLAPPPAGITNTLPITIVNPVVSIENGVGFETGGSGFVRIPVRLSNALPIAETVTYSTVAIAPVTGTLQATAGAFTSETNQTITFTPGQTLLDIEIPLSGTPITEAEVFGVSISRASASATRFPNNPSTAYILNAQPTLDVRTNRDVHVHAGHVFGPFRNSDVYGDTFRLPIRRKTPSIYVSYTSERRCRRNRLYDNGRSRCHSERKDDRDDYDAQAIMKTPACSRFRRLRRKSSEPRSVRRCPSSPLARPLQASAAIDGGGVDIEGQVTDNNGNPMAGVYIYVGHPVAERRLRPAERGLRRERRVQLLCGHRCGWILRFPRLAVFARTRPITR